METKSTKTNQTIDFKDPSQLNPMLFWTGQGKKKFPLLAKVSSSFLSCPVSTGSAERVFSIAGKAMSADRVRLGACHLEAEVMLTMNSDLVSNLFYDEEMIDD